MESLRARKKLATRQSISDTATELFMAHGFDNTTIVEIASAADVSPQTVANYFPTKADMFFDDDSWLVGPPAAIREQCPAHTPAAAVLQWYLDELRHRADSGHLAGYGAFRRTIFDSATLRHRHYDDLAALTDAIAAALADRFPRMPHWRTRITAARLTAALTVCEEQLAELCHRATGDELLKSAIGTARKVLTD